MYTQKMKSVKSAMSRKFNSVYLYGNFQRHIVTGIL